MNLKDVIKNKILKNSVYFNFFLELRRSKKKYDEYWQQNLSVNKIDNRLDYFLPLCENKSVLHFGCTDYPIFDPENNLHIKLHTVAKELHGFDVDINGIAELKKYVDQPYFTHYELINNNMYDICLIPETIEHVDNVGIFLENLKFVNAKKFVITGPNCFVLKHMLRNSFKDGIFIEIIHPDHNCWYSPYTLKNVIEKYSPLKVQKIFLLQQESMVCCECVKKD